METCKKLCPAEIRLLLSAPEVFAILWAGGSPRPWTQDDLLGALAIWKLLDKRRARDVLGLGWIYQRSMGVIPSGLEYPRTPLWRLPRGEALAWLSKFRQAWEREADRGREIPEFFTKIGPDQLAIAVFVDPKEEIKWH